jgi:hypothetical protein
MKVKDQPDHPIVDDLSPPAKRCARMYVISVLLGKGTSRNSVEHAYSSKLRFLHCPCDCLELPISWFMDWDHRVDYLQRDRDTLITQAKTSCSLWGYGLSTSVSKHTLQIHHSTGCYL